MFCWLCFSVESCKWNRLGALSAMHTRQSSTRNEKYQVSPKHSCFSWWWAHSRPKHVEIDKYYEKVVHQVGFICSIPVNVALTMYVVFRYLTVSHTTHFFLRSFIVWQLVSTPSTDHIRALYNNMNVCWNVEVGDLISYLMVFSFCIRSCSCVMVCWWSIHGVETSC